MIFEERLAAENYQAAEEKIRLVAVEFVVDIAVHISVGIVVGIDPMMGRQLADCHLGNR